MNPASVVLCIRDAEDFRKVEINGLVKPVGFFKIDGQAAPSGFWPCLVEYRKTPLVAWAKEHTHFSYEQVLSTGLSAELSAVYALLCHLRDKPDRCIVRGVPTEETYRSRSADGFTDEPSRVLFLDIEKYVPTCGLLDIRQAVEETLRMTLPDSFANCSYIYQLTAKCGISSTQGEIRLRAIFILDTPARCCDLKAWRGWSKHVDKSVFRVSQPIFTHTGFFHKFSNPYTDDERCGFVLKTAHTCPFVTETMLTLGEPAFELERITKAVAFRAPAVELEGAPGAVCRAVTWPEALTEAGYSLRGGRWLPPGSESGAAGVVLFDNGYAYSHHDTEHCPISEYIHYADGRIGSINVYDFLRRWKFEGDPRRIDRYAKDRGWLDDLYYEQLERQTQVLDALVKTTLANEPKQLEFTCQVLAAQRLSTLELNYYLKGIAGAAGVSRALLERAYREAVRALRGQGAAYRTDAVEEYNAKVLLSRIGPQNLVVDDENLWSFNEDRRLWSLESRRGFEQRVYKELSFCAQSPTDGFTQPQKARIMKEIETTCYRAEGLQTAGRLIAFQNGVLDVQKLLDLDRLTGPVALDAVPLRGFIQEDGLRVEDVHLFPFDSEAPCDRWLAFLDEVFEGDAEQIRVLQQLMGYLLIDDYRYQKIWCLEGIPRSGKSTLLHVMSLLVGRHRVCATDYSSLGGRFGLEGALGKRLMVLGDAHQSVQAHNVIKERLQSISGGDPVYVDRKGVPGLSGVTLKTRIVIACNDLPGFFDVSGAFGKRLLWLRFNVTFYGREESRLRGRLEAELPGILVWSLAGLLDLWRDDAVYESQVSLARRELFDEYHSAMTVFVQRYFQLDRGGRAVIRPMFFDAYFDWLRRDHAPFSEEQREMLMRHAKRDLRVIMGSSHTRPTVRRGSAVHSVIGDLLPQDEAIWRRLEAEWITKKHCDFTELWDRVG